MSSMLEQAIVDAEALREAALKNAEDMIVEKYSNQIKEAVESLLEQPELPPAIGGEEDQMGLEDAEMPLPGEETEEDDVLKDMPVVTVDGEKLCPCPAEEEEYEVDFTELTKMKSDEDLTEPETQEDLAADILGSDEMQEEPRLQEEASYLDEEISLDEDLLTSILEELVVDIEPVADGWGNNGTPTSQLKHAQEQLLARAEDTKVKEENEALKTALEKLKVENQTFSKEKEQLKEAFYLIKDKLTESSLSNAKLLYTNKVLISDSLNGRQKNKIVEAISEAETVEEAKVIYETLQNAVGSTITKTKPQSLSEAVKSSSAGLLLHGRNQKATKTDDPSLSRWKVLAGLK
jgi:hypothetical protein